MIVDTIDGDLITIFKEGKGHIIHGCNCSHIMGAGLAKQIRDNFFGAYVADTMTKKGKEKLGSNSVYTHPTIGNMIFNAYTQGSLGETIIEADHIRKCFRSAVVSIILVNEGLPLYTPKIGAGIAGCSWEDIYEVIDEATGTYPVIAVRKR
ncbi:hypothetical protein POP12_012 [Pectobacterium phage POP12]|nr:hypothetical protein POP12_012 [Pectobacterium phage POP12]